jgi:hydroxymethylbilane synthase
LTALRIGTRGSALALWQAKSIAAELHRGPGVETELVIIRTSGDKFQQTSFSEMGTKGVFIKELEDALLEGRVDLAVHSMKDVPTEIPGGLTIAAICKREDVRDALLSAGGLTLEQLPTGARVGTSSLRRQSQLLHARSDLRMLELRGNVDTRIEKLKRGDYDAIVLAKAGLDRLGLNKNISQVLSPEICLPAAGQGAIGIEARAGDSGTLRILGQLNDAETRTGVEAERAALAGLEGGCQVSIGAWGRVEGGKLILEVAVLSPDGAQRMWEKGWGAPEEAKAIGARVSQTLRENGAAALLVREGPGTRA